MEKNRGKSSTGSPGVCDVIYNLFRCFSFGSGTREPPTVTATLHDVAKIKEMNPKQEGAGLPVQKQPVLVTKVAPSDEPPIASEQSESLRPQPSNIDIRFSSYIERAKSRLRRMPSTGGGGGKHQASPVKDARNDRFTDYINRAGRRLRSSSNIGLENSKRSDDRH